MTKIAIGVLLSILIPVTASAQIPEAVVPDTRNASAFVSDVTIPDGTMMSPGQSFTKTWQIKNSGSTIWSGYSLAFDRGTQMGGPSSVPVPALVEAMRDTNAMRRKLAIQLLAPLGSVAKEAVPTLHELADNDPAPQVRNIANEALKFIEQ